MKPDLYEALGVGRDAPMTAIRSAYRKAAKKAHPDGGGSVERFALVKLAHDTLSDPGRRKHYDHTGETRQSGPDTTVSNGMETAFATCAAIIGGIIQQRRDPEEVDIVKESIWTLKATLQQMNIE